MGKILYHHTWKVESRRHSRRGTAHMDLYSGGNGENTWKGVAEFGYTQGYDWQSKSTERLCHVKYWKKCLNSGHNQVS